MGVKDNNQFSFDLVFDNQKTEEKIAELKADEKPREEAPQEVASAPIYDEEETGIFDGVPIPTLEEIIKLFDNAIYRMDRGKLLSDVFECGAIAISNQFDFRQAPEREKRYKQIMSEYEPAERELITKMFSKIFIILTTMSEKRGRFNDWLGELYMRSRTSNDKAGQFFTPYNLSKLCAKMVCDWDIVEDKKKNGEILSIQEPACGSGGMILAALDIIWNEHKFNYATQCFVEATDVDARCVHMCYLQLSLAGVPAIIKQQDALSRQLWNVWYTPAYLFQYTKFKEFEKCAHM